ncbi:MAG: 50S ribosomal protein L21 [Candidatus Terrybacteria bacterium RIFCSPHIGHO2_01_FULL_58_15]|uniref:Large ribosomal subunit protein bL21 n=1 Tax=Terrybacteria sp. (strain RIFCSPHIGHO2_01_FULL_58_15) TaxID=1802363 RepID=A0A1G2PJC5_TERXR|nr:MAG: 50S ribosomal protein L21 [Candidatus Terrybacteria bacterium RIFCSPHIGHO2_01_FULL_58_15]
MRAIIRTGGKQYLVSPGTKLKVEKVPQATGDSVVFEEVLLVVDEKKVSLGRPLVSGATVLARVLTQAKRPKQVVFKMRPKKRYRVKRGHRQPYTEVEITAIEQK